MNTSKRAAAEVSVSESYMSSSDEDKRRSKRVKTRRSGQKSASVVPYDSDSDSEDELSRAWSREDKIVLQKTLPEEIKLWDRTLDLWDSVPAAVLPAELHVELGDRLIPDPRNEDESFRNTNWSKDFCNAFATVMLCPVFHGSENLQLWHCAIRMAMRLRLGNEHEGVEDNYQDLTGPRNDILMDIVKPLLSDDLDDEHRQMLPEIFDGELGKDILPDSAFLEYLEAAVNRMRMIGDEAKGLVPRDFAAIGKAWDDYVLSDIRLQMKHRLIKGYSEAYGRLQRDDEHVKRGPVAGGMPGQHRKEILQRKKEYIMQRRSNDADVQQAPRPEAEMEDPGAEDPELEVNEDDDPFSDNYSPAGRQMQPSAAASQSSLRSSPSEASASPGLDMDDLAPPMATGHGDDQSRSSTTSSSPRSRAAERSAPSTQPNAASSHGDASQRLGRVSHLEPRPTMRT